MLAACLTELACQPVEVLEFINDHGATTDRFIHALNEAQQPLLIEWPRNDKLPPELKQHQLKQLKSYAIGSEDNELMASSDRSLAGQALINKGEVTVYRNSVENYGTVIIKGFCPELEARQLEVCPLLTMEQLRSKEAPRLMTIAMQARADMLTTLYLSTREQLLELAVYFHQCADELLGKLNHHDEVCDGLLSAPIILTDHATLNGEQSRQLNDMERVTNQQRILSELTQVAGLFRARLSQF